MRSYKEIAVRYLKSNKRRTILTIIGIILSMSLLTSAGVFGESLKATMLDNIRQNYGNFHVQYNGLDESQIKQLENHAKVENVGYMQYAAVSPISKDRTLLIAGSNKENLNIFNYKQQFKGKFPTKDNEIILEQWVLDAMNIKPHIGEKITLNLNIATSPEGITKKNAGGNTVKKDFVLSGILENKQGTMSSGTSIGIVSVDAAKRLMGINDLKYSVFVNINKGFPIQTTIKEIQKGLNLNNSQVKQNNAYLTALGQSGSNSNNRSVTVIELVAMFIIIITTVAVIYNAFHISALERIHQFGVLRSIGATPKQIRSTVLTEALILSVIGIPFGLLFGSLAVQLVIGIFSAFVNGFSEFFTITISPWILIMSAVLGFLTILFSAYGPAFSAGRISPMEAILNNARQNISKFRKRKHPILKMFFGIEGVMSYDNLKRTKKRFYITVSSICLAISLFIFFSFFMNMMIMSSGINAFFHKDFSVSVSSTSTTGFTTNDYNEINAITGVKKIYRVMEKRELALFNHTMTTNAYKDYVAKHQANKNDYNYDHNGTKYASLPSDLYGYRDMELNMGKSHIISGSLDIYAMNKESGVLVYQKVNNKDATNLKVGDTINVVTADKRSEPMKLKVVGILDGLPFKYTGGNPNYSIITTENGFKKITGIDTFARFDVETNKNADKDVIYSKIKNVATKVPGSITLDYRDDQSGISFISTILYGIVIVISLIGAINIINTISTNLILRIREFGTLRAIGMTMGQIKKMIRMEGILYGIIGTIYGGIIGIGLSRLIYVNFNRVQELPWITPWIPFAEAAIVSILIGLFATSLPMKRIEKMNVVDSIRIED